MRFTNDSGLPAGWTVAFNREGREVLVVVVKATFDLPAFGSDAEPALSAEQAPLVESDTFTGEPGMSAPAHETDYAHTKPGCDVLLQGRAHAPGGRPVERTAVGLQVGPLTKRFVVVGDRRWERRLAGVRPGTPVPFLSMPVGYDNAFGGADRDDLWDANPVGRGFGRRREAIDDRPLPNTEEADAPVNDPAGPYRPMAFGPIGRSWLPRRSHAGTYDDAWAQRQAPFWPDDFDDRYFQAAPPDQVIPWPQGGEPVVLANLTPDGHRSFHLPRRRMPVLFAPYRGRDLNCEARIDTIVIEPELNRFSLTWRVTLPLGRSVFDVEETVVGDKPLAWHRARQFPNKTYYRSLAELVSAQRRRSR